MFRYIKTKLTGLYQSQLFLPILIGLTYLCLLADTLKYPGFIGNHFVLDAKVYFVLSLMFFLAPAKNRFSSLISLVNKIVLAASLLIYLVFIFIEEAHYPNYALATYHFHLDGLIYLVLFSLSLFILGKIKNDGLFKSKNFGFIVLAFLVAYTLAVNVGSTLETAFETDTYILLHLRDSYDQKMFYQWHDFYNYMLFVKTNTPDNASIIIPPQIAPWWTRSGNAGLVKYFLYPRTIIQYSTENIPDIKSLPQGTYIMIAWGEWGCDQYGCKGWPTQIIKSKEAIFKDPNSNRVEEVKENFIYDPKDTSHPFGLLKL